MMALGLGLTARAARQSWLLAENAVRDIFAQYAPGYNGVWYDPSDLSTLFQDAIGTIPVTAVEQPVGLILDKSKGLVLGAELIPDPTFSGWADPSVPDGWTKTGTHNATNYMQSSSGGLRIVSDGTYVSIMVGGLTVGRSYEVKFDVTARVSGAGVVLMGAGTDKIVSAVGAYKIVMVANSTSVEVKRYVACDITFDNISVRELPGNHAYQSTSASRPVLSARVNMLTKTEQFDDAAWFKSNSSVTANATTAPDGTLTADKLIPAAASVIGRTQQNYTGSAGTTYTLSVYAKQGEFSALRLYSDDNASNIASVYFNLISGAITTGPTVSGTWTGASATSTPINAGWYRFTLTWTATGAAPVRVQFWNPNTGDGTSGIYLWGADLRPTNSGVNLPPYQRVGASTDYDTAGFPHYLKFDGIDDSLVTNSIDFTATDKMTVCAGVRKLSDAERAMFVELSANAGGNNGVFQFEAPSNTLNGYLWGSKGTALGSASTTLSAPRTNVATGLGNISGDSSILRINGTQAASSTSDQGTGNFGNYPLYIGRRGDTSLPFNGHLYSLVVCGKLASAAEITATEAYINQKTRAY